MLIKQELSFRKFYKKLHNPQRRAVQSAIQTIMQNPHCGEKKKQDLANIYIYKFRFNHQLFFIAYEFNMKAIIFLSAYFVHKDCTSHKTLEELFVDFHEPYDEKEISWGKSIGAELINENKQN